MELFGHTHRLLLAAILCTAAAVAILCRREWLPRRATRLAIGWTVAANELVWWVYRYSREGVHTVNLPLQLCDLTVWLAVVACLTVAPMVVEFAYFAGLAGAGVALLTPNVAAPWPQYPAVYFFIAHGGIVVAAGVLAFGGGFRFRPGAVWRAFGWLAAYTAAVAAFNAACGANYMFLCRKPERASAFDLLGPWPWYAVAGAAIALGLFWLLWLPVRPGRGERQPPPESLESTGFRL
jgi:hypothetical integral membrane protein (TIGR02206 family)